MINEIQQKEEELHYFIREDILEKFSEWHKRIRIRQREGAKA